ncbi:MAG: S8 family peptidase [Caulobacteraceae bacterium]|nr:S8 family peptidase [Caulobacteraceae bacterium]
MALEDFSRHTLAHLTIDAFREAGPYTYPARRQTRTPQRDDYVAHGRQLLDQLAAALPALPVQGADPRLVLDGLRPGAIVSVETRAPQSDRQGPAKVPTTFELPAQDLVVLRTSRRDDRSEVAVVFVPDAARPALQQRITAYGAPDLGNRERPHVDQFERIEAFAAASAEDLFAGDHDPNDPQPRWWELWVREGKAEGVRLQARAAAFEVHADTLIFPDVEVAFVHAAAAALRGLLNRMPGAVAEVRRSVGTIEPFLALAADAVNQHDFVADFGGRIQAPAPDAPAICILDTGVSAAHPLVAPGLAHATTINADWGTDDHADDTGHGTGLASLALFGDLEAPLNDLHVVQLGHAVESVKLLAPRGAVQTDVHSYGAVTQSAISVIEIDRPGIERSFCLASSTARHPPTRPSSWSGAIDQAAAGAMSGERARGMAAAQTPKRLMLVAAGNVIGGSLEEIEAGARIEDPAQAWNALTVGGVTAKTTVEPGAARLRPLAAANTVSPYSADTVGLPTDLLPMKPEVMFEAGNMTVDAANWCDLHPALSLLAAGRDVENEPLSSFWATSAAVAVGGHFLGRLKAELPGLWPETYRALMVHSARWPEPIRRQFIGTGASWRTRLSKADIQRLLRRVGYGVPDLDIATRSARNEVTLLAQAEIQPYAAGANDQGAVFNEVHFYDLPWPVAALRALGDEPVTMRVTLSYFIEPNLSGKAATRPETYRSYGLRFALKKRTETDLEFKARLSRLQNEAQVAALEAGDEDADTHGERSFWLLGPKAVQAGSLHCDLWRGKASDLIHHDLIAVHPVGGWWKSHLGQHRRSDRGRYALALSISAPSSEVDLYSESQALVIDKDIEILLG